MATQALLDTGSQVSAMALELFATLESEMIILPTFPVNKVRIVNANKGKSRCVTKQAYLQFSMNNITFEHPVLLVKDLLYPIILGVDFLQAYGVVINYEKMSICFRNNSEIESVNIAVCQLDEEVIDASEMSMDSLDTVIHNKVRETSNLNEDCRDRLHRILCKYKTVFGPSIAPIKDYLFRIKLTSEEPFKCYQYPIPQAYRAEVEQLICNMLESGVIVKSNTPYINPILIVKKKNGKIRLCLDARKLNSRTVPYYDRPPRIDEILQKFYGVEWYTETDFTSSYWQLAIHPDDQKFTGFLYAGCVYHFTRVPFGLVNSGAALIQCIDQVLGRSRATEVLTYVDDVVLFSKDQESHLAAIEQFLLVCKNNNIVLNLEKSFFFVTRIMFLGYVLDTKGVHLSQDKLALIDAIPPPRNLKQLRGVLGTTNYYSRFCPNYAMVIHPLLKLLKKGVKFLWTSEHQSALDELKAVFYKEYVIEHPDFERRFFLQTDSSDYGLGAVLYQKDEDSRERIVALISRTLRGPELRYSTTEREALAIVWAVQKLRVYLVGREFSVITDHKALVFLSRCYSQNSRLMRWILSLQEYSFVVEYCEGKRNVLPDLLSRNPTSCSSSNVQDPTRYHICLINLDISDCPELTWEKVRLLQRRDPEIQIIYRFKRNRLPPQHPRYAALQRRQHRWDVHQGMVLVFDGRQRTRKVLIPESLQEPVILFLHTKYGHFGPKKVTALIREFGYFPKLPKIARKTIAKCLICQKTKFPNRHFPGQPQHIIPQAPNELCALDLYGPLPLAQHGYKHILVIIDVFSKFVQLYPVKKPSASVCLKNLLTKFFAVAGNYQRVLSDHGSQFTSQRWVNALRQQGVTPTYSSVRYPQGNPSERVMREIARLCRTYCHATHNQWAELIPSINIWLNHLPHDATGISGFEAHFKIKPEYPFSGILRELASYQDLPVPTNADIHRRLVFTTTRQRGRRASTYTFRPGDRVLLRVPHVSSPREKLYAKFFLLFQGPYVVSGIPHPNVAALENRQGQHIGNYNFYNLRPYVE